MPGDDEGGGGDGWSNNQRVGLVGPRFAQGVARRLVKKHLKRYTIFQFNPRPTIMSKPLKLPPASLLAKRLAEVPQTFDYVLPGLRRGTVGALISPGGVGKSFWVLGVAVAIASGIDFCGLGLAGGKVVVFSAEDAEDEAVQRLRAIVAHCTEPVSLAQFDFRDCLGLNIDVMVPEWLDAMIDAGKGARLIVLDTLSRFHNLDENDARDMKRLMAVLERLAAGTQASVLYLHHTSKMAALSTAGASQQAARGSTVLVDNARWAAFLAPMTESEARRFNVPVAHRDQYVRWNISKQNYGAAIPDRWYQRTEGGALRPVQLNSLHVSENVQIQMTEASAPLPEATAPRSVEAGPVGGAPADTILTTEPAQQVAAQTLPSATQAYGGNW